MYWWIAWHTLPLISSLTINKKLEWVNKSTFTFAFFLDGLLAMLIMVQKENKQDEAHVFKDTYCERLLNTSSCNNVSLSIHKSWYSPNYLF